MKIFPATDIKGGQVVRLTQGDYDRADIYGDDPTTFAAAFMAVGAKYLHIVDLDGAKDGELSNFDLITKLIGATSLKCEIGGGIRDEAAIKKYLDAGAYRVILGTTALEEPEFLQRMIKKYDERIAVGVDARDGMVAVKGWLETSDKDAVEFCRELATLGVKNIIYTDISRDGAMIGANLEVYGRLATIEGLNITASGGITKETEISALANMGIDAAIIGKALYNGALSLEKVLAAAGKQ